MKLIVQNHDIAVVQPARLVSGSVKLVTCDFRFDETWDGYIKTAVFTTLRTARAVPLVEDQAVIPWEVLQPGQRLRIGVFGVKGDSRLPTVYTPPMPIEAGAEDADEGAEPTPDKWEQLLAAIEGGGLGGSGGLSPADEARLSEQENKTAAMQKNIGDLQDTVGGVQDAIEEMQGVAGDALTAFAGVQQDVTELQTTVGDIQDSIEEMQGVAEGALGALVGMQQDIVELQQAAAPAKNVDLSKFESEGKIEQTAADGVTKLTYTFTFDAQGNPAKIVNPDGSETTLTW